MALDLRYQGHRLQQPRLEEQLLSSIAQRGIQEPLQGVRSGLAIILLNGFKRYRCARKLHLLTVPFASWGADEVTGILQLLRGSRHHALHLLEEARFVDELKAERGMSVAEIAQQLSRSKAWVSLRLGLMAQLSPTAIAPADLRPFQKRIDELIEGCIGVGGKATELAVLAPPRSPRAAA